MDKVAWFLVLCFLGAVGAVNYQRIAVISMDLLFGFANTAEASYVEYKDGPNPLPPEQESERGGWFQGF